MGNVITGLKWTNRDTQLAESDDNYLSLVLLMFMQLLDLCR